MWGLPMNEQNAKANAICESDKIDELEDLITDFMSDSNDTRSDAKSIFQICTNKPKPHLFANKLYRVLSSHRDLKSRTIPAILLRKLLINKFDPHDSPFLRFPPETQSTLKRDLLKLVDPPAGPINKELCNTVSALAVSLLPKTEWPEFLPFLFELVESDKKRALALLIVACLAQYLGKELNKLHSVNSIKGKNLYKKLYSILLECLTDLPSFLLKCLTTEGEDVRIAALGAAINFILCLEQKDLVNFQDLLATMMSALKNALCSGNETMAGAVNTLKLLISLAGMKPKFLRKQIVEMVKTILLMADDDSLEKETRRLAIEFVLTLVQFVFTLAEVEKTEFEINMEEMWDDKEETDNYGSWQGCVDRLSILSDRNDILTVALEVLPAYLDAPEWQKKHAAVIVLTKSIESCREVTIENLKKVVPMILSPFQNANSHVRRAAIEAIQQLTRHFRLHGEVMRTNFEQVLSKLLSLFQDDDPVMQTASIRAIMELASNLGDHLQVGCHLVLPALAAVMEDSPNQDMRGSAASTILVFSEYCTRDNLREHLDGSISSCLIVSKEVKEFKEKILFRHCDRQDRLSEEWVQLWRNKEQNEEPDLSPYLEILMSPVFHAAQLNADAQLSPDEPCITRRHDMVILKKAQACRVLCFYVSKLGELLVPEINQIVDTLIPFLRWDHDPSLPDARVPSAKATRIAAASALPRILYSARPVVESSDPEDYDHKKQYFEMLSDKVKRALEETSDVRERERQRRRRRTEVWCS